MLAYKRGQGSIIIRVKILDSSSSSGRGLTGLTFASSGLIISTIADNEATATVYAQAAGNTEDISALGTFAAPSSGKCRFKEVDGTNHKGVYEIQLTDSRYAVSNAKSLLVSISGATNMAETDFVVPLWDVNPYSAADFGMTNLDATIASRLASASYTSPPSASTIAAAVWTVGNMASAAMNRVADFLLRRLFSGAAANADADLGSATGRNLLNAERKHRNKKAVSGDDLIIYQEDDATEAWRETLTTDSNADPIVGADPTT